MSFPYDLAEVERTIRDLVRQKVGQRADSSIHVETDVDSDGYPILRVTIAVEPLSAFGEKDRLGFVRHLRNRLGERNVDDFPVVSYVSKAELDQRVRASA